MFAIQSFRFLATLDLINVALAIGGTIKEPTRIKKG